MRFGLFALVMLAACASNHQDRALDEGTDGASIANGTVHGYPLAARHAVVGIARTANEASIFVALSEKPLTCDAVSGARVQAMGTLRNETTQPDLSSAVGTLAVGEDGFPPDRNGFVEVLAATFRGPGDFCSEAGAPHRAKHGELTITELSPNRARGTLWFAFGDGPDDDRIGGAFDATICAVDARTMAARAACEPHLGATPSVQP